jgi:tripartite-type tricarboxylate transporter receptor subunit TctC
VDLQARLIAIPLAEILGQPVVVEDKAGAGGAIGLDFVAKSPPDGYTIGIGTTGPMTINPYLIGSSVPYDPNKDFAPIGQYGIGPNVIVINASVPAKTLPELIALAKAKPVTISYASSSGIGSTAHLAGELLGIRCRHRHRAHSVQGKRGRCYGAALESGADGDLRVAADDCACAVRQVASARRLRDRHGMAQLPDVPTVTESASRTSTSRRGMAWSPRRGRRRHRQQARRRFREGDRAAGNP